MTGDLGGMAHAPQLFKRSCRIAFLVAVAAAPMPKVVAGIDHIPVAVRNLDLAAADFEKLGFLIKPGRLHADGLRNMHVKFPNGGGIELMTVGAPTDALAKEYEDWLKAGDGPAFWSLYSPDLGSLAALLFHLNFAPMSRSDVVTFPQTAMPHRLFFADRLRSPNDGPSYWAHPNSAYKIKAVWLSGLVGQRRLLADLGAQLDTRHECAPFDVRADRYVLPGEGDEVIVTDAVDRPASRSVIGVTVLVKSLFVAQRVLDANHVRYEAPRACRNHAIWITPAAAHNLWLELRE